MAKNDYKPGDKPLGWFSRRHPTAEQSTRARERYKISHPSGPRPHRITSPAEQLLRLDMRLGKGVGAQRERARLKAML